jgi:hypothetical protein
MNTVRACIQLLLRCSSRQVSTMRAKVVRRIWMTADKTKPEPCWGINGVILFHTNHSSLTPRSGLIDKGVSFSCSLILITTWEEEST